MREEAPRPYFNQDNDNGIPSGVQGFDAQQSPEAAILAEVSRKVALMYAGDVIAFLTEPDTPTTERDQAWEKTAQSYPQYASQIRELRQALLIADKTRDKYIHSLNPIFLLGIRDYEDDMAGRFLAYVYLSRITTSSGHILTEEQQREEYDSMYRDLGREEGKPRPVGDLVTVQEAARAVLQGRLRVLSNE